MIVLAVNSDSPPARRTMRASALERRGAVMNSNTSAATTSVGGLATTAKHARRSDTVAVSVFRPTAGGDELDVAIDERMAGARAGQLSDALEKVQEVPVYKVARPCDEPP